MNTNELRASSKEITPELSKTLNEADIRFLVNMLNEKDEKLRYNAFLATTVKFSEVPQCVSILE
jgi:hypothetical protein